MLPQKKRAFFLHTSFKLHGHLGYVPPSFVAVSCRCVNCQRCRSLEHRVFKRCQKNPKFPIVLWLLFFASAFTNKDQELSPMSSMSFHQLDALALVCAMVLMWLWLITPVLAIPGVSPAEETRYQGETFLCDGLLSRFGGVWNQKS